MRKCHVFIVLALSLIMAILPMPLVQGGLENGTLANAMNTIINANNWTPTSSDNPAAVAHFATIFSVSSGQYQTAAQAALSSSVSAQVLQCARIAELDGFPNAVSDSTVQNYLSSVAMVGYLPVTYQGNFLIYHRYVIYGYEHANGANSAKWSKSGAVAQINSLPGPHLYFGVDASHSVSDTRYYDGYAQTQQWIVSLGADLANANALWDSLQQGWNGYYGYHPGDSMMETEVGPFALVEGEYLQTVGRFEQYSSRIVSDLNAKLLVNGYNSPLWNHYSLNHVPGYDERRTDNCLDAWGAMQAYYPIMTSAMQTTLQSMGSVGWRGLLTDSNDFIPSSNLFQGVYQSGPTGALASLTGDGLMILFLNGIVPKTGSLAIPLKDECYQDSISWNPATMFNFNYGSRTIKIPVNAGVINFIFGTGTATYTFPQSGIYQVSFSQDWNTVTGASYQGSLDSRFKYVTGGNDGEPEPTPSPSPSPPPQNGTVWDSIRNLFATAWYALVSVFPQLSAINPYVFVGACGALGTGVFVAVVSHKLRKRRAGRSTSGQQRS